MKRLKRVLIFFKKTEKNLFLEPTLNKIFNEQECFVAWLLFINKKKEYMISLKRKLGLKNTENLSIRVCSIIILHRAGIIYDFKNNHLSYHFPKKRNTNRNLERIAKYKNEQSFFKTNKALFKNTVDDRRFKVAELYWEHGKNRIEIGKTLGVSNTRIWQLLYNSIGLVENKLKTKTN